MNFNISTPFDYDGRAHTVPCGLKGKFYGHIGGEIYLIISEFVVKQNDLY